MIDHGLYVVRSLVQVGDVILATGLAASGTIEAAEDQARLRALALLNFEADSAIAITAIAPTPIENKQKTVLEPISTPLPKIPKAKKGSVPLPTPPLPVEIAAVAEIPSPLISPSSPSETFIPEEMPELVLLESVPLKNDQETELVLSLSSDPIEQNGKLPLMDLAQTNEASVQSLLLEELSLLLTDNVLATPSSEIETSQSVLSPTSDLSEPIDFSEVIARSNIELKRLNWTNDQGKNYLLQTYGKRSRQLLSDEELLEFLQHLESQPSPPSA